MPNIIVINKSGEIDQIKIKSSSIADLYKKAGFKSEEHFALSTHWNVDVCNKKYSIHVYGKKVGRANQENKYDFPPPIDTVLFFGSVAVVNMATPDEIGDLTLEEWNKIYEKLFGGFEDICDKDSVKSEDESVAEDATYTNNGYVKDGFVVSDNDAGENDSEPELPPKNITIRKKGGGSANAKNGTDMASPKKKNSVSGGKRKKEEAIIDNISPPTSDIEYTSELEEEPYI